MPRLWQSCQWNGHPEVLTMPTNNSSWVLLAISLTGCRFDPNDCLDPKRIDAGSDSCPTSVADSSADSVASSTSGADCNMRGSWTGELKVGAIPNEPLRQCVPVVLSEVCAVPIDIDVYVTIAQDYVSGLTLELERPDGASINLIDRPGMGYAGCLGSPDLASNLSADHPLHFGPDGAKLDLLQDCWLANPDVICGAAGTLCPPTMTSLAACEQAALSCSFVPAQRFAELPEASIGGTWQVCVIVDASVLPTFTATLYSVEIEVLHD